MFVENYQRNNKFKFCLKIFNKRDDDDNDVDEKRKNITKMIKQKKKKEK